MRSKKMIAALFAAALAAIAAVSVSADEMTDAAADTSTTVTATIQDAGEVEYIITVPQKVDFGTLEQPEANEDDYTLIPFRIEATQIGFTTGQVSVRAKDGASTDGQFYITQKSDDGDIADPFKIQYDFYKEGIADFPNDKTPVNAETPGDNGYLIVTFDADSESKSQNATLALNQKQLYGKDLTTIAGNYSGTIIFHSEYIKAGN